MSYQSAKKLPYGVSNFVTIVEKNNYYVDKTMYIPMLEEEACNLFFIRPRRFGKSLFLGMLHAYYDCRTKDKFEQWFGNLWIGQHPTSEQGRYQVLHLDFSQVGGKIEKLEENFDSYCRVKFDSFVDIYKDYYSDDFVKQVRNAATAVDKLTLINDESKKYEYPLYLIIDEYDNFTNTVLNEQGEDVYWAITHAEGFYRDIFKKFKGSFERIFITGVSPVTLDDVTSGFNIGWHISTKPEFNQMLGFSTEDVRDLFTYYKESGAIRPDCDIEAVIEEMKPWYDNYCFSEEATETQSHLFNPTMVLYFIRNYISYGHAPAKMIDSNTRTNLHLNKLNDSQKEVIRSIAERGEITCKLYKDFPAHQITDPKVFPSLLFYYGMLTIKDTKGAKLLMTIPNNNVRKQYYGYLQEIFEEKAHVNTEILTDYYYDMAYDGKWHEGLQFMADAYAKVSSVRDGIEAERNLQGFFMAYLNLNPYYYTAPELELNHGFCDFFLLPDLTHYATKHSYILELKMLHKVDTEATAQKQWDEAVAQINAYAQAPRVEALRQGTQMHKIIMQFDKHQLRRMEEV